MWSKFVMSTRLYCYICSGWTIFVETLQYCMHTCVRNIRENPYQLTHHAIIMWDTPMHQYIFYSLPRNCVVFLLNINVLLIGAYERTISSDISTQLSCSFWETLVYGWILYMNLKLYFWKPKILFYKVSVILMLYVCIKFIILQLRE